MLVEQVQYMEHALNIFKLYLRFVNDYDFFLSYVRPVGCSTFRCPTYWVFDMKCVRPFGCPTCRVSDLLSGRHVGCLSVECRGGWVDFLLGDRLFWRSIYQVSDLLGV